MNITIRKKIHNDLWIEGECADLKEAWKLGSDLDNCFNWTTDKCHACGKNNIYFSHQKNGKYDYYELKCRNKDCRASKRYGTREDGQLYPWYKFPEDHEKAGEIVPNYGWVPYQPEDKQS